MAATRTLGVLTDGLIESRGDRQPHVTTLAATNSEHNQPPQRRVITRLDAAAFGKCKTSRGVSLVVIVDAKWIAGNAAFSGASAGGSCTRMDLCRTRYRRPPPRACQSYRMRVTVAQRVTNACTAFVVRAVLHQPSALPQLELIGWRKVGSSDNERAPPFPFPRRCLEKG